MVFLNSILFAFIRLFILVNRSSHVIKSQNIGFVRLIFLSVLNVSVKIFTASPRLTLLFRFKYDLFLFICRDKVVDFHWNAHDPWTLVSVSDDCESTGGGGTLQVC